MSKIVFDADGLIKMAKSGALDIALECFDSFVSQEVFDEAVTEGKKLQFEDADTIEEMIKNGQLKIKKYSIDKNFEDKLKNKTRLGPGEISAVHLFNSLKADAIITDDQKFIRFLESEQLPIIVPASLIHKICQLKKISKWQALSSLQKIRKLIKDDTFEKIERKIKEDEK